MQSSGREVIDHRASPGRPLVHFPGDVDPEDEDEKVWLVWPLPILLGLLVFFVLLSCSGTLVIAIRIYRMKCAQVRCHLCRLKIPKLEWDDGSHREQCLATNRSLLSNLPSPFDVRCPKCLTYLKLFPKNLGYTFTCDDSDCPVKAAKIRNNGFNRLSCFACDYDLCDSCVHRRQFVLTNFSKHFSKDTADSCSFCQLDCGSLSRQLPLSAPVNNFPSGVNNSADSRYQVVVDSTDPYRSGEQPFMSNTLSVSSLNEAPPSYSGHQQQYQVQNSATYV